MRKFVAILLFALCCLTANASDYVHQFGLNKMMNKEKCESFVMNNLKKGIYYNTEYYWVLLEWGKMDGNNFSSGHDMINSGEYWRNYKNFMIHANTGNGNWLYIFDREKDKVVFKSRTKMDEKFDEQPPYEQVYDGFLKVLAVNKFKESELPEPFSPYEVMVCLTVDNFNIYRVFALFNKDFDDEELFKLFPAIPKWEGLRPKSGKGGKRKNSDEFGLEWLFGF